MIFELPLGSSFLHSLSSSLTVLVTAPTVSATIIPDQLLVYVEVLD